MEISSGQRLRRLRLGGWLATAGAACGVGVLAGGHLLQFIAGAGMIISFSALAIGNFVRASRLARLDPG
jgi:hypothetical protein